MQINKQNITYSELKLRRSGILPTHKKIPKNVIKANTVSETEDVKTSLLARQMAKFLSENTENSEVWKQLLITDRIEVNFWYKSRHFNGFCQAERQHERRKQNVSVGSRENSQTSC